MKISFVVFCTAICVMGCDSTKQEADRRDASATPDVPVVASQPTAPSPPSVPMEPSPPSVPMEPSPSIEPSPSVEPTEPIASATKGQEKMSSDDQPAEPGKEAEQTAKTVVGEYNRLNANESYVILRKGTEPAGLGGYTMTKDPGTYVCRQCNAALYRAEDKFESHCGWPSFDDEIEGAVDRNVDEDGVRTEIVCSNCGGHLGHVFFGENMTEKNTRHCVNSISMRFFKEGEELPAKIIGKPKP